MAAVDTTAFDNEVARALRLVGAGPESPAADALVDPVGAAAALGTRAGGADEVILRVVPELVGAAEGYGPRPADPMWMRVRRGSADVALAPLRLRGERGAAEEARVKRVAVVTEARPCCAAPSCKLERTVASAWIELEGEGSGARRLLAAEARDLAPEKAVERVSGVASALAGALGVSLVMEGNAAGTAEIEGAVGEAERDGAEPAAPRLTAAALARFALRSEGDRIVIRDHASAGPRVSARRTLLAGALILGVAVLLWVQAGRSFSSDSRGAAIGFGALAALASLTAYAFLGIGRFAARYAAESAPIVALGRDRMIIAPWVSRDGAVDLRPEGRLGAAIPVGEVHAARVRQDDGLLVIELETDHGPMVALTSDRQDVADVFCEALRRSLDEVRHPKAGVSARQRARGKAQGAPA